MESMFKARFGYISAMRERPISVSGYPELENLSYDWHEMPVSSARQLGNAALKDRGFAAVPSPTAIERYDAAGAWQQQFAREVEATVKAATGAREVVVPHFAASVRSTERSGSHGPAHFCHNDFTPGSAARHITALDPELAEKRLGGRFAAYNLWRLVSPAPQSQSLALCDARSVQASDFVPGEARYMGPDGIPLVWGGNRVLSLQPRASLVSLSRSRQGRDSDLGRV